MTSTTTTTYVYDGDNIALEITSDGTTTTKTFYTHGFGVDEPLAMEGGGSFYYYHADGLGSITAITDAARNVRQRYTYDSFGMPKAATTFRNSYQLLVGSGIGKPGCITIEHGTMTRWRGNSFLKTRLVLKEG